MGTYVDLVLRIPPARFRALVPVQREQDEDGELETAAGLPVYFGIDHVSLCTLNGAGWTPAELLREARELLGEAVLHEAGTEGTALSLEGGGAPKRWEARLAAYPHCSGSGLVDHADDKLIDVLLGGDVRERVGAARDPRMRAAMAWLDAQPAERFQDRPPPTDWPDEPDDAALDAIEREE